jgi:sigma-B regulation protein RsbU (phosphoserine phosphatase)
MTMTRQRPRPLRPIATRRSDSESDPRLRWWRTLHVRLALMINLIAVAVLTVFWVVDYRREIEAHIGVEAGRLREEARVLRVARGRAVNQAEFQAFLDEFCEQMGVTSSPGHHIAVFDAEGAVVARAHARADPRLEAAMATVSGTEGRFLFHDQDYLAVRVPAGVMGRIVITQSLRPIHEIIRAQAVSRALSLALLAVLIFGATTLFVLHWVRDPLYRLIRGVRAIGERRFGTRVEERGSPELRFLAAGVNEMTRSLEAVERERGAQLRRAREIQSRLLPRNGTSHGFYEITACFRPAESVAGDLYDIIELADGSLLLAVLDVSGHGVAAALYTALLRTVLRSQTKLTTDPNRIAQAMNNELAGVVGGSGEFATCFLLRLDPSRGAFEYVGAGHDPAIVMSATGKPRLIEGEGLAMGIRANEKYPAARATLQPGERLFLYTDGLHEVFNADGVRFGRKRLIELLRRTIACEPAGQLDQVIRVVRSFAGNDSFDDDVTLVCISPRNPAVSTALPCKAK